MYMDLMQMNLVEIQMLFFKVNYLGCILASIISSLSVIAKHVGIELIYWVFFAIQLKLAA